MKKCKAEDVIAVSLYDHGSYNKEVLQHVCDVFNIPTYLVKDGCKFFNYVASDFVKAVISASCGSGKTTFSYYYIYNRFQELEALSDDTTNINSIWLVVDRLETGQDRVEGLLKLGIDEKHVGFYHSFWAEGECHKFRKNERLTFDQISKDRNICRDCIFNSRCKGYQVNRRQELKKPIVIMTHEGFIRLHELGKIPADVDIVIDEEISNFYSTSITRDQITKLLMHMPYLTPSLKDFRAVLLGLLDVMDDPAKHCSTVKYDRTLTVETKKQAIIDMKAFIKEQENGKLFDRKLFTDIDWYGQKISEIGYALPKGCNTYLFPERDGNGSGIITIARDRINLQIPNKVVLLNGSAECSRYPYESMPIVKCRELERIYGNVSLYLLPATPTKKWLRKEKNLMELLNLGEDSLKGDLFIAVNKSMPKKQMNIIEEMFPSAQVGCRGSIIGSNEFMDIDNGLIAMSLFTKISIYALMASLRNKREYKQEEIFFKDSCGNLRPKFKRNNHLMNEDIDYELQLHSAYELHQTILRLSCRKQQDKPVNVVLLLPHYEMIALLQKLMPGFKVADNDDKAFKLVALTLNSSEPITNSYIYEHIGWNKADADQRKKVEDIMEAFGWSKEIDATKRGHNIRWVRESYNSIESNIIETGNSGSTSFSTVIND